MKKFIVLAALLFAYEAKASCTYASSDPLVTVATCTTTTEAAPTLATEGYPLGGLGGFTITITAPGAMTAGGVFQAYLWNSAVNAWTRAPDLDLVAQALTGQSWPGFAITVPGGRIDYKPTGTGAQTTTIYFIGARR